MPLYACIENLHDMPNPNKVTEVMTSYIWLSSPLETCPLEYLTPVPVDPSLSLASMSLLHSGCRLYLYATSSSRPLEEGPVGPSVLSKYGSKLCAVTSFAGRWRAEERDYCGLSLFSMPFLYSVKGTSFGQSKQMHFFFFLFFHNVFLERFWSADFSSHCYKVVMQIISSARSSS